MKKFIYLCTGALLLSSCGVFKSREVDKKSASFSQEKSLETSADSSRKTTDKTVTIETKTGDSTVRTPAVKTKTAKSFTWGEIFDGLSFVDSALRKVTIRVDTIDMSLLAEIESPPQEFNFKVNERKETYANKTDESRNVSAQKSKEATAARNDVKSVVAKPKGLFWLWAILAAAVVVVSIFIAIKFKKLKSPF